MTPTLPTDQPQFAFTILLPTRGRPERLEQSIRSLIDLADDPKNIQILIGHDNDDAKTHDYFKDTMIPWINEHGISCAMISFDRLGYVRLNEYYNRLAQWAKGSWLIVWNDDAVMKEAGWDTKLRQWDGEFKILAFDTHNHHPYSIFPVIPIDWYRLMGTLSNHQMIDAVVSQIAYMLDIMERTDIKVDHERADLEKDVTKADDTFKERILLEGNPQDPRDLNSAQQRSSRYLWADRISWWLASQGQGSDFWSRVKKGEQDPWEKLKANDPNGLTKQDRPQ